MKSKTPKKRISPDRGSSRTLTSGSKHEDESDSSSSSSTEGPERKSGAKGNRLKVKKGGGGNEEVSSLSGVNDEGKGKKREKKLAAKKAKESGSSSSSDSVKEVAKNSQKVTKKVLKETSAAPSSSSSSSDSDSDSDARMDKSSVKSKFKGSRAKCPVGDLDEVVTKKRRTSESGAAIPTATASTAPAEPEVPKSRNRIKGENGKAGRKPMTPFRRVDPDSVPVHVIKDNRYEAKVSVHPFFSFGHRCLFFQNCLDELVG
jgi:hypothetical protein